MTKKTLIISFVIIVLTAAAGYYAFGESSNFEIIQPVRGHAVHAVYATGTVEASVMIPISSKLPGRLMELFADEGQNVNKGMVMAQLEDADLQNAVNERKASLTLAKKEYDRQLKLLNSGAIAKNTFDKAQASSESAEAALAQAEANLNYMKLIAPEDGLVIRRDGEIGAMITANQPVLWLSCCKGLRISAEVDEEDISLVKPGQNVVIKADAFPGEIFKGTVQSITPKGDAVSRSYRVRISLEQNTKLMIGMTAETNIIINEKSDALLVPSSAVTDNQVYLIRDNKAVRTQVEIGAHTAEKTEIRKGMEDADFIVLNPGQKFNPDDSHSFTKAENKTETGKK